MEPCYGITGISEGKFMYGVETKKVNLASKFLFTYGKQLDG